MSRSAHQLRLERGAVDQGVEHLGRAQIGEQLHLLAQAQKAALGLRLERQRVVLRAADRAEQHRVRLERLGHDLVGQGRAVVIVGGAADPSLVELELEPEAAREPVHDPAHLAHHLRADAIARQQQDLAEHAGRVADRRHHAAP